MPTQQRPSEMPTFHDGAKPMPRRMRMEERVVRLLSRLFQTAGPWAPRVLGKIALEMFVRPRRYDAPGYELTVREQAARAFHTEYNGKRIACWEWGSKGPLVLLIHGWEGRGSQLAMGAGALVEAGFRVLAFDGPAHGLSDGKRTHLMEFAGVIHHLADSLGPIHTAIAHSFGGAALTVALRQGFRPKRVVLIAVPASLQNVILRYKGLLRMPDPVVADFTRRLEHLLGIQASDAHLPSYLRELRLPGLIIHDEDDRDVPAADAHALHESWDGSHLYMTSGLGHRRILRNAAVIARIAAFTRAASCPAKARKAAAEKVT